MSTGIKNRVGNYHYADGALVRRGRYLIGIAGAYNAFGLIGSEHNGIFVLDDEEKLVVLDGDTPEASGYTGPSQRQWDRLAEIKAMAPDTFRDFLTTHPRSRIA